MKRDVASHSRRIGLYEERRLEYQERTGKVVSQLKYVLVPLYLSHLFVIYFGVLLDIDGTWVSITWSMTMLGAFYYIVQLHREKARFTRSMRTDCARSPETPRCEGSPSSTQKRAFWLLEAISLLVPRRISDEEIGDALELVGQLSQDKRPAWQIYLKVASTIFWVGLSAIREVTSSLMGKKKPVRR